MEKVEQFYNKNQFLIKGRSGLTFQSYKSTIANISPEGKLKLFTDWDYSNTTRKHLYLFLREYRCCLDDCTKSLLWSLEEEPNKRAFIQKLIDNKKIEYVEV